MVVPGLGDDQSRGLEGVHLLLSCREKHVYGRTLLDLMLQGPRAPVVERNLRPRMIAFILTAQLIQCIFQANRRRDRDRRRLRRRLIAAVGAAPQIPRSNRSWKNTGNPGVCGAGKASRFFVNV